MIEGMKEMSASTQAFSWACLQGQDKQETIPPCDSLRFVANGQAPPTEVHCPGPQVQVPQNFLQWLECPVYTCATQRLSRWPRGPTEHPECG